MAKKVVVVLPTYNEKNNIEKTVNDVLEQEKKLPGWKVEILIADSSSPDGTGEVAKNIASKNPKVHFITVGRGLGVGLIEAHRYSLKNLHPDIMAQLDADGQVEPDVLVRLVKAIEEGNDLALGSRFVRGGKNMLSLSRRLFSAGSSLISRTLIGPWNIKEVTNSARAFTPELFKKINLNRLPWKEKTFIKFGVVGLTGTLVDFFFYKFFINSFGIPPATSKGMSAEIAIVNNFIWNHFWTFKHRKTNTNIYQKFGMFNLVSLGGLIIGVLIVKFLHSVYGDGIFYIGNFGLAYNNLYFFATIPPVMIWNFFVNHLVTWKHIEE